MKMKYERIRQLRKEKGMTQQEVAKYLHIHRRTYCAYENGRRSITARILIRLADLFDVSTDYIVNLEDTCKHHTRVKR